MPDRAWLDLFDARMRAVSAQSESGEAISVKVRVTSGCFHREHSPTAYGLIDEYLAKRDDQPIQFVEHESGPELLVWIGAGTAIVGLTKSLIDLLTTILKARQEGARKGDRPDQALQIIVRKMDQGEFSEQPVLTVSCSDNVSREELERALKEALTVMLREDRREARRHRSG